jgi:hypothetical protein
VKPTLIALCLIDSLTQGRTNRTMRKYRRDALIKNQLKIDKLDQNQLPSIEKIQTLLYLTLLN